MLCMKLYLKMHWAFHFPWDKQIRVFQAVTKLLAVAKNLDQGTIEIVLSIHIFYMGTWGAAQKQYINKKQKT